MLNLTPSGTDVLLWTAAVCLLLIGLVLFLRRRLQQGDASMPASRTKAAGKDVFAYSGMVHRLALCVAIGLAVLAVNWTQRGEEVNSDFAIDLEIDDFDVVIPPTVQSPPPPPPPPPPPIEIEPTPEPIEEDVTFKSNDIDANDQVIIESPKQVTKPGPPPPPPPLPKAPEPPNVPMIIVERMPVFGEDCRELSSEAERKACSDKALLSFLSKEVKYPALARENNIQGRVTLQFIVERDGSISGITVVRGVGAGLDEEAERVVKLIDEKTVGFSPGMQQGYAVRVRYTVPIVFRLNR